MTTLQVEDKSETLRKTIDFLSDWQEKSRKNQQVNTFFTLLARGKWAAADRALDKMRQYSGKTQWQKGYLNALEGMIISLQESASQTSYIHQINPEKADQLRRTFQQQARTKLHDDFDRGYFTAWADYAQTLRLASRAAANTLPEPPKTLLSEELAND